MRPIYRLLRAGMIICSCNVLSETSIRDAVDTMSACPARSIDVHHHLGCRPKCGCCANSIRAIIQQQKACAPHAQHDGCPERQSAAA
jgi:bacterioferritin-associated ferredoxin